MGNIIYNNGFNPDDNHCVDIYEKDIIWIYQGKKEGYDHWEGIPRTQ